ncbi:GNAT family N-acetyltransferase [Microbulbifer pacificus]|uniref:GNAT family N-acetyltransferase n=1 Tax=Microbulbifer pacificus TaxID=407164 RepID=A0AAU0N2U7_9GAMM|nr:GNAT family N-acetyltransferase [Microbulbifer pacificus]WOX06604.1 GNAT family N-acetyltransferase [Microbulbifer pacificus]
MEAHTSAHPVKTEKSTPTPIKSGPTLSVELTWDGAKKLLHSWEHTDHKGAARVATAKANFFLPFIAEMPGEKTPYVALWNKDGVPDGMLLGRLAFTRPVARIGNWQVPMPLLRTLNITEGGLEALTTETALQQKKYLQELLASGNFDCISIFRLAPDSEVGRVFENGFLKPGDGFPVKIARWFTELLDSHGRPIAANSAKTRSGFRRKDRKLVEAFNGAVEIREIRDPKKVTEYLKMAVKIGAAGYQRSIGVGVKDDPIWNSVFRIHAENGNFRGYLLEAEGEPIAYIVGPVVDGTFSLLATSYLPKHSRLAPGTYLLRRVIERLQDEGIRWIDYGEGDYSYKELYGTYRREDASMNYYASSPRAKIAWLLNSVAHGTMRFLHSSGLLVRLKKIRRFIIDRLNKNKLDAD